MRVGDILAEWDFTVEAGKLREFGRAVGDAHADTSPIAPPTFPMVISAAFVERLVGEMLGLDRSRTVHGEQRYAYFSPIVAGDRLHCVARLVGDEVKAGRRGGSMRFITTEVEIASATTGTPVCRETMISIEKGADAS